MPLSAILVSFLILISLSPTTSRTSPAPDSCTFVTSAAPDPCLTQRYHHITPDLKSLHWLKIPERIHFEVLSPTYNSLQFSQPTYTFANSSPSSQPALLNNYPLSTLLQSP